MGSTAVKKTVCRPFFWIFPSRSQTCLISRIARMGRTNVLHVFSPSVRDFSTLFCRDGSTLVPPEWPWCSTHVQNVSTGVQAKLNYFLIVSFLQAIQPYLLRPILHFRVFAKKHAEHVHLLRPLLHTVGRLANQKYRFFRYLQPFLQFSDAHFHIITIIQVSQHFLGQILEGNQYLAFACLPSRPNGLLLWLTTSFAVAAAFVGFCLGTAGLLPQLLVCPVSCRAPFFTDSPAILCCLPRNGSASLMCRRAGKYCCLFSLSTSGRTLERPLSFLASTSSPKPQCPLSRGRKFPGNLPLPT